MQAKGLIKVFLILLALVCILPIFYTVTSRSYDKKSFVFAESKLKGFNENDKSLSQEVVDSMKDLKTKYRRAFLDSLSGKNVGLGITLGKAMERQLGLGLDLKGGMSVVMAIEQDDVLSQLANGSKDPQFMKALGLANAKQQTDARPYLILFQEEFEKIDPKTKLAGLFMNQKFQDKINFGMTNSQVIEVLQKEVDASVKNTFNVVKTRIDQFGVVQPNVNLEERTGRILLELPGVEDPKRVESILQTTAELGFWYTYDNREIGSILFNRGNDVIRNILTIEKSKAKNAGIVLPTAPTNDLAQMSSAGKDTTKKDSSALAAAVIDTSKAEKVDSTFNPLFDVLQPSLSSDQKQFAAGPIIGYAKMKDMDKVNAFLDYNQVRALFNQNVRFFWSAQSISESDKIYALYAIKDKGNLKIAPLGGDAIIEAVAGFDQGTPIVSLTMDGTGADKWKRMTHEAADHKGDENDPKECIAIVLDNKVFSAPIVNGEISGGRSQITMGGGKNGVQESQDLANVLKAGKLDAKTRIIEESVVGPTLGAEAIQKGMMSFIIALVLVMIVMVMYYNKAGIVADIALMVNIFFIFCAIVGFGTVLTLPGLAGIILTIGMAVDTSIIIFERIREELARGKSLSNSISDGFTKSYSAIIDANVANFYTAFILYYFGKGPIKGFGTILMIGIGSSILTGVVLSRIIFEDFFIDKNRSVKFDTAFSKGLFKNFNFDFVGKSKLFIGISVAFIIIGTGSALFRGFDLGVDFKGGRKYVIRFDKPVNTSDIAKTLDPMLSDVPVVKTYGTNGDRVQITTAHLSNVDSKEANEAVLKIIYSGVKGYYANAPTEEKFNSPFYIESSNKIGATVAEDIKSSSIYTSIIAIIGIFVYIAIRFRKWQFGAGVVVSLIHDVAFTLGVFSIFKGILPFSLEVDQTIVAAVLTLIGYSMNDTVVVFDRIRENLREHKTGNLHDLFNFAMNSTLSRTIMTSFYTFTTMLIIFIFGGETVRGFSFAMLIGILVGTYSSIFIAAPVAYHLLKGDIAKAKS